MQRSLAGCGGRCRVDFLRSCIRGREKSWLCFASLLDDTQMGPAADGEKGLACHRDCPSPLCLCVYLKLSQFHCSGAILEDLVEGC